MSTPAGTDTTAAAAAAAAPTTTTASQPLSERRKSLGKYVKRMSSVFKREKSSLSVLATASSAGGAATPTTPTVPAEKAKDDKDVATAAAAAAPNEPSRAPATPAYITAPITQELNRAKLQQERARQLFAKYGLTLEAHEWFSTTSPVSVQRIERPIRMRVHRSCHHCGTVYGADKVCVKCTHHRCKKCPRCPTSSKRSPDDKERSKLQQQQQQQHQHDLTRGGGGPKLHGETPQKKRLVTVTTHRGEERVYQPVKQRVRRTCHKCNTPFVPATATTCATCTHTRCTKCPRSPANATKYPSGYPGDVVAPSSEITPDNNNNDNDNASTVSDNTVRRIWRKPRTRVRWECDQCAEFFIEGTALCPGCGHQRCGGCSRKPVKSGRKVRELDQAVIRAVEEKLRALAVDDERMLASVRIGVLSAGIGK